MSFRTIESSPAQPLRVVVAGAGNMGRAWLAAVIAAPDVELAGVADLNLTAAQDAIAAAGRSGLPIGSDAVELARQTGAQALINVTIPEAHHAVTTAALFAGLPVLGEKPVAESVSRALSLVAATEITGELFMVSQSRRWNPQLARLRAMAGQLGPIGTITTDFFRAPHFGGFREHMAQPLLIDMAIHAFDAVRFLLGCEPVSVYCQSYNPEWSWYAGHANATAVFEMESGTRYVYNGSWCSAGAETSWNGRWRVSGQNGTALWNGDDAPTLHTATESTIPDTSHYSGIDGALHVFVQALRTGQRPSGEVHENVMSLAMVEAAVQSARIGRPARIDAVLTRAHADAIRAEDRADVCHVLQNWPSVRDALATPPEP
ncbi:Gfo/Idh/MocA family protein [Paractinoplanes hotanensis]|uniref:Gfo/Idh/MocA family oxidoreductase n=1 Tax=Paractinoplanes hotanensis TaxID=2906497 RepID=A0ABT0XTV3_9ACTN|nr:Gfo/Idh/MocA family oxidoreductase [Actinoplanes hotanensis]MCM4076607.1 Gfo/Idh/MocA family oxidoreductase [Actinoplanes hotanensis]